MLTRYNRLGVQGIIGIDFGSHSIKAVALTKKQGVLVVEGAIEICLKKDFVIDGRLQEIDEITTILKKVKRFFPASFKYVAIAVSGSDVITKTMVINNSLSEQELLSRVEMEAENTIPFPLDEIFIDFEVIGVNLNDPSCNDILVSAARKESVLSQVQCVDQSGLKTVIVDVATHALARAVGLLIDSESYHRGVAILDIGASQMTLSILYKGNLLFTRSKNHGCAVCNKMLSETYGLSMAEVEKIKTEGRFTPDCIVNVISPFINMTINHLRFELRMFTNSQHHLSINKLLLTGGGTLMEELVTQLSSTLDLDVDVANPSHCFQFKNQQDKKVFSANASQYMLAIGLALRGCL